MRTPEFTKLLDMLNRHPEFSADYDNDCDTEIIAYGKHLWAKWEAAEVADVTEVDAIHSVDQLKLTNRVSPKTREILQAVVDGLAAVEIRNKFSISNAQLNQLKYKYGLTKKVEGVRNVANSKCFFEKQQVISDLERLNSVPALAKEYGIGAETLRRYMKRNGISFKTKPLYKRITKQQVAKAIRQFATKKEVAASLSVSVATFDKALQYHSLAWEDACYAA